jgi:hypothetical protein
MLFVIFNNLALVQETNKSLLSNAPLLYTIAPTLGWGQNSPLPFAALSIGQNASKKDQKSDRAIQTKALKINRTLGDSERQHVSIGMPSYVGVGSSFRSGQKGPLNFNTLVSFFAERKWCGARQAPPERSTAEVTNGQLGIFNTPNTL